MDVQQLRSWIFEVWDPVTEERTYILFDRAGATLVDIPPFSKRALLRITGTCRPSLVFFTHARRAQDAARWREALPDVAFAIHEADAAAVAGGVERAVKDGEPLTPETVVVNIGAHTPGASALLAKRTGGVLFPGDAVIGMANGSLRLPDPAYAPAEKIRAGIEKLRPLEFSSVLSMHGPPVWSAGKDRYLELLETLPRPRKRFGVLVDAPWDARYRGHLQDQMVRSPLVPAERTIDEAAAHGPTTLVPAWERKPAREVTWEAAARPAARATEERQADAKRWSLARERIVAMPPRPPGPVETLPGGPYAGLARRYAPLELSMLIGVPYVDWMWRSLDLSPDGAWVTFAWNRSGNFEIYRAPIEGDAIYQLTSGGQRSVQPRFSPNGRTIAFIRDRDGDERFAIWLIDASGANERRLTEGDATRYSIAWSPDGSRIAFVSDETGSWAISTIDVKTGERTRIAEITLRGPALTEPVWSRDGRFVAYASGHAEDASSVDIFVAPLEGGRTERVPTRSKAGLSYSPSWDPRGEWLAFTTDERGRFEVAAVPMRDGRGDGEVRRFGGGHYDESGPVWLPDGRAIGYRRSAEAAVSVRRIFVVSQNEEPLLDTPGVHYEIRFGHDGRLVYTWSDPRSPNDVYVKRRDDTAPRPITRSLPPTVDLAALVTPIHVTYPGAEGESVPALLYLPDPEAVAGDGGMPPGLVYVHGGPTAQHLQVWDPEVQWLVNQGYVVIAPNVRGSTGYGRAFREANRRDWGGKDLADVISAADWLEREGLADGRRIGIFGGSYGGYLTLLALGRAPKRWAAGCDVVGIVSLETLHERTRGDLRTYLESEIGSPAKDAAFFRERSPITYVDRIEAPLLVLHGKNDPRVPLDEARQVIEALRARGKAFSFHVYEDEGHGFRRTENRRDALVRMTDFFGDHLKERRS